MRHKGLLHSVVHTTFGSSRHLTIAFGASLTATVKLDTMCDERHVCFCLEVSTIFFSVHLYNTKSTA